jgi:hypothetical protein
MSFTVQEIQGVPYWLDAATNAIFLYGSSPPLQIAQFDPHAKRANFTPTWKEDVKDFLIAYRQRLGEKTEAELKVSRASASASAPPALATPKK